MMAGYLLGNGLGGGGGGGGEVAGEMEVWVGGLVLGCDRVPFTLSSACKFSAALAIQPITPKEL